MKRPCEVPAIVGVDARGAVELIEESGEFLLLSLGAARTTGPPGAQMSGLVASRIFSCMSGVSWVSVIGPLSCVCDQLLV